MSIAAIKHVKLAPLNLRIRTPLLFMAIRYRFVLSLAIWEFTVEMQVMANAKPTYDDAAERVISAAQAELLGKGFDAASIDAIAARAGVSKTTIYSRFPSKSALFADALRLTMQEAGASMVPDVRDKDMHQALRALGNWVERSARAPANLALYRANIVGAAHFPELSEELHGLRSQSTDLIAFVEGLPGRAAVPDISARQLASWLGVIAMGGLHHLLDLPDDPALHRARTDAAIHLFANGWRTPVERSPAPPPVAPPSAEIPGQAGRTSPERWTELLHCTARSLLADGVRGTSVDGVSAASGLSKMTIYRRFGGKDELIAAALTSLAEGLAPRLTQQLSDGDLIGQLTAVSREYLQLFARPDHIALLRLMVGEAPKRPELVAQLWRLLTAPSHAYLTDILRARAETGELHITDPLTAAEQFLLLSAGGNRLLTGARNWNEGQANIYADQLVAFCLRKG